MNDAGPNLDVIQRWLLSVITHPQGIEAGIESPDAQREIVVSPERVEEVIARSRACTSIQRLAVYGNAYYARLIECLAAEFPALKHAVGEEAFASFVVGYLQRYPSRSYTLARLGAVFPKYLDETRPTREDAAAGPDWPEFLVDLATVERVSSDVFDGPGEEGDVPLSVDRLREVPTSRLHAVRLATSRSLRLVACRFPVQEYIAAVRREGSPEIPGPVPTWLAIHRRHFIVHREPLNEFQFRLLSSLQQGSSLGEAIEFAVSLGSGETNLAASIEVWFREWTASGYFRGIL